MGSPFSFLKKIFDDSFSPAEEPDAVEAEYRSVLEILETMEGDPDGLSRALSEAERRLQEMVDSLQAASDDLEASAEEKMSGDDLEVMLKMMPSLFNAARNDAAFTEAETQRGARLDALMKKIGSRKKTLDKAPAEQLERIIALLEAVRLSDEVTGRLGSIF